MYKCPKCGRVYDKVDFKTFRCKCGYKPVKKDTKIEFKKYYNKVMIVTTQKVVKDIKDALRELDEGIAVEEEKIEAAKSNIKIFEERKKLIKSF